MFKIIYIIAYTQGDSKSHNNILELLLELKIRKNIIKHIYENNVFCLLTILCIHKNTL